jgi:hypothetical protein
VTSALGRKLLEFIEKLELLRRTHVALVERLPVEYEIEDRPQMGEDCEYEYLVTRTEFRTGTAPARFVADRGDCALLIPEQEAGS